jgi:hypothetical protein
MPTNPPFAPNPNQKSRMSLIRNRRSIEKNKGSKLNLDNSLKLITIDGHYFTPTHSRYCCFRATCPRDIGHRHSHPNWLARQATQGGGSTGKSLD